jgi:hypothetical protein
MSQFNILRPCSPQLIDNYFDLASTLPTDIAPSNSMSNSYQVVTRSEISHYGYIFQQPILRNQNDFNEGKEAHIYALLYVLRHHVGQIDGSRKSFLKL